MSPEVSVKESMEDRIKEFRSDPQKMDVTTKFVNEVVEKAKEEALKRMKEKDKGKQKEEERQKIQETSTNGDEWRLIVSGAWYFNPNYKEPETRQMAVQSQRLLLQAVCIPLLLQHGDQGIDS